MHASWPTGDSVRQAREAENHRQPQGAKVRAGNTGIPWSRPSSTLARLRQERDATHVLIVWTGKAVVLTFLRGSQHTGRHLTARNSKLTLCLCSRIIGLTAEIAHALS
jgi:hypothetical protein